MAAQNTNATYSLVMPQYIPYAVNCGKCKQHMLWHTRGHAIKMHCCDVFVDGKCMIDYVMHRREHKYICMTCPSCNDVIYNF